MNAFNTSASCAWCFHTELKVAASVRTLFSVLRVQGGEGLEALCKCDASEKMTDIPMPTEKNITRSEELLKEKWDRCIEGTIVKGSVGTVLGGLASFILFRTMT